MEMGFDPDDMLNPVRPAWADKGFSAESLAGDSHPASAPLLDWSGLRARFLAAHALRRALDLSANADPAGGSFVLAGAQVLEIARQMSTPVNPTVLCNGKAPSFKEGLSPEIPTLATKECDD